MLFILMLNKVVDKMLPCGTPCDSPKVSDKVDPTLTWIDLFARKLSRKLTPNSCRSRKIHTGQLRYVKLAYLENTTCVEVIVHSRTFPLYVIVFRPCIVLRLKLGCIEVIFHSHEKFSISFTTGCVEVKMYNQRPKKANFHHHKQTIKLNY